MPTWTLYLLTPAAFATAMYLFLRFGGPLEARLEEWAYQRQLRREYAARFKSLAKRGSWVETVDDDWGDATPIDRSTLGVRDPLPPGVRRWADIKNKRSQAETLAELVALKDREDRIRRGM